MTRTYWAALTAIVLALLFAAGAVTFAAGNDNGDEGGGSSTASGAAGTAGAPGEDSADAGFARDMSVHHQQAVEMSFIVRDRTKDEEVRRLAYDIANTQANQRGMMLGWLDLWGLPKVSSDEPMAWMAKGGSEHDGHGTHGADEARDGSLMPGMATRTELAQLREADGKEAEILYLRLMTAHHKGGVTMAQGCADQCEVPTERSLAQGMVDAQESEIALMADLLKARGATARP